MTATIERPVLQNDASENSEDDTIISRFDRQVAAAPDKCIIVSNENALSYQALDLQASRVAAALASFCSKQGQPIVIFVSGEVPCVTAMLGALKANRIFVPLASSSPEGWVSEVIKDSGSTEIIVDTTTRPIAKRTVTNGVQILEFEQLVSSASKVVTDNSAHPDDAAYIVYTSGSTGRPKGVAVTHRGLLRRNDIRNTMFPFNCFDRSANLRSSASSAGINATLLPLLSGGCLFPFDLHRYGLQELAPWLIAKRISYIGFSGSLLRSWLASLPDNIRFPSLQCIWMGGEPLYARDVIRLSRHLKRDWRIAHTYSSTECGTVSVNIFTASCLPDSNDSGIVSAGRPVDGVKVYIKADDGAILPQGQIGEIVVQSRFLSKEYWNNPELTAKVFQNTPSKSGIRTFLTGDLGLIKADGTLEHRGRKGRKIRLRGYTVEPFDVERALLNQPGVTDATVFLHEREVGEEPYLIGYVVAPSHTSATNLRKALAERLPSYCVPSHIIVLDAFPIASSGKIDRKALPSPFLSKVSKVATTASNGLERELCTIWREVLKTTTVGVDDDFFELGGTSLQALLLFARIERRLGYSLSPTTLLRAPTIKHLAELMQETKGAAADQSLVPLRPAAKGLPLFFVHSRVFFFSYYRHLIDALKSGRPVYGLQPPPMDGKRSIPRTVESIAADYVAEIRRVQPHGPYAVAGHSFGGRVSFEIAQQLVREGEEVSFLGLIDTAFRASPLGPSRKTMESGRLGHRFWNLIRHPRYIWDKVFVRVFDVWLGLGLSVPHRYRARYYDLLCIRATRRHAATPYSGHITMFSSAGNSDRHKALWGPLALGGLTVLEVPGGHHDMMLPPHCKGLAQYFDRCLKLA
jgi:acyl-coenzyme A synthetase/AMP-(fatty) acid ligase/thioesterase domain-containing protein/acyl carrier protein